MTRTKWLRLGVRDAGDILRWAGEQNVRHLEDFRHRIIRGREFASFRMVPRYMIELGTGEIVVVAYVQAGKTRRALGACRALYRRAMRRALAAAAAIKPPQHAAPEPTRTAELHRLAGPRVVLPAR